MASKLEVHIIQANNLYNADWGLAGKSDPYCVVSVVGNDHIPHLTTPVMNNNLNPEFNFKADMHGLTPDMVLQFEVFDKDIVTSTSLGSALLPLSDVLPHGIEGALQLTGDKATGTLDVHLAVGIEEHHHYEQSTHASKQHEVGHDHAQHGHHQQGGSKRADKPHPHTDKGHHKPGQSLVVEIVAAHNLANKDGWLAGKSDPYAMCFISGQSYKTGIRTKTINNDLNPRWGFSGTIYGFDLANDTLEFQVWDDDTWPKPDQTLGKVLVSAREHDFSLGLEGVVDILDGEHLAGSLEIKVTLGEVIAEDGISAAPAATVVQHAVSIGDAYAGGILVAVNVMPPVMRSAVAVAAPQVVYQAPQVVPQVAVAAPEVVKVAAPAISTQQVVAQPFPVATGVPLSSYAQKPVTYAAPQAVGSVSLVQPAATTIAAPSATSVVIAQPAPVTYAAAPTIISQPIIR